MITTWFRARRKPISLGQLEWCISLLMNIGNADCRPTAVRRLATTRKTNKRIVLVTTKQ